MIKKKNLLYLLTGHNGSSQIRRGSQSKGSVISLPVVISIHLPFYSFHHTLTSQMPNDIMKQVFKMIERGGNCHG